MYLFFLLHHDDAIYDIYGTHYVSQVTLGAKHIFSSVMNSQDVLTLKKTNVDVAASVSARGFGIKASASFAYSKAESSFDQVKSKITTVNEINIGGTPPEDGNWKTWAATVAQNPMPILYELSSIADYMPDDIATALTKGEDFDLNAVAPKLQVSQHKDDKEKDRENRQFELMYITQHRR